MPKAENRKLKIASGYSLIETVVYAAILATLAIFVVNTLIISFKAFNQGRTNRRIVIDAETALERIVRESRMASSVDEAQSIFDSSQSNLVLNSQVSAEDAASIVKKFFISGGRLAFQEGAGSARFLTAPNTSVSSFVVSKSDSAHSQSVKVSLVLVAGVGSSVTSRSFYTSAVLRGGY
ncbi:MAG: hypothetical protein AAB527_03780 [Patescibacteria group bacterium]